MPKSSSPHSHSSSSSSHSSSSTSSTTIKTRSSLRKRHNKDDGCNNNSDSNSNEKIKQRTKHKAKEQTSPQSSSNSLSNKTNADEPPNTSASPPLPTKDDESQVRNTKRRTRYLWLLLHYLYQTWTQVKHHKASYVLGLCSCLVVVVIVGSMLSVLGNAPIIFLRIAELDTSEIDVQLQSNDDDAHPFLNYTTIASLLSDDPTTTYHSPRWALDNVDVYRCENTNTNTNNNNNTNANATVVPGAEWMYRGFPAPGEAAEDCYPYDSCFLKYCSAGPRKTTTDMLAADSARERRMLLGRTWDLRGLGEGEAHVSSALANKLGVGVGDTIVVRLVSSDVKPFDKLWALATAGQAAPTSDVVYVPLRVAGVYSHAMGRIPSSLKTEVIVEYGTFGALLGQAADPADTGVREFFRSADLAEYAERVVLNYPPPRSDPYMDSDMDSVRERVARFASDVVYRVGFHAVKASLPVMEALYPYSYISMFLGLIIDVSIVVLLFLCVILIYSLLVINVESRTFELGVLRMVGSTREEVVGLLLTQALAYALPAWVVGLPLAQLVTYIVFKIIEDVTDVPLPTSLTGTSIGVATVLCFAIPVIAAILPIRFALRQNLSESLDSRRSKTQAVKINVERSEHRSVPWTALVVGVFLTAFGVGVIVVFPTSLISLNMELLLGLFFVLIVLMLVGFVFLSLNLECLLYRLLALVFFFWDKLAVRKILVKNLIAHRLRNRKTTVMYSVSMSFIIFMFVAYSTMMKSFSYEIEEAYGTTAGVRVSGEDANNTPYTIRIAPQLEEYARTSPFVEAYAWRTLQLADVTKSTYVVQNIGRYAEEIVHVYGVSPNFFDVAYKKYINFAARAATVPIGGSDDSGDDMSVSELLYADQGAKGLLLGAYYRDSLGLKPNSHFVFTEYLNTVTVKDSGATSMFDSMFGSTEYTMGSSPPPLRKKAFAFMNTAPGFSFSKFSALYQDAVVSFPHYIALSRGAVTSMHDLPLGTFYLRLKSDLSDNEVDYVKQNLTDICTAQNDGAIFYVWNLRQLLSSMDVANDITTYFFVHTLIIFARA